MTIIYVGNFYFRILHILILWLVPVLRCEIELNYTAYVGGNIQIRCPYESKYEQKSMYFCSGDCMSPLNAEQNSRISVQENESRVFTVTITNVKPEDKGMYCCVATSNSSSSNYKVKINRTVKPELISNLGENISIHCHYNQELRHSVKFLCTGPQANCTKNGVKVTSEKPRSGHLSLTDKASAGVFIVTFANLREEDAGIYWCGAYKTEDVFISSVVLDIFQDAPSEFSETEQNKNETHWGKGVQRGKTSTGGVLTSSSPSGVALVVGLSVLVVLLLLIVLLYVLLRRRPKKRDNGLSNVQQRDENREVAQTEALYEEIKDRPDVSSADDATDGCASPADPTLDYATVSFVPKSSSSDQSASSGEVCVYATVSRPDT